MMNSTVEKSTVAKTSKSTKSAVSKSDKASTITKKNSNSFAVINYLNSQFKVTIGSKIWLPLNTNLKTGKQIIFKQVLIKDEIVGTPYVKNFTVVGKCLQPEVKDKKVVVFKYKSKKNYRVKTGHRQRYTLVEITNFQENKQ